MMLLNCSQALVEVIMETTCGTLGYTEVSVAKSLPHISNRNGVILHVYSISFTAALNRQTDPTVGQSPGAYCYFLAMQSGTPRAKPTFWTVRYADVVSEPEKRYCPTKMLSPTARLVPVNEGTEEMGSTALLAFTDLSHVSITVWPAARLMAPVAGLHGMEESRFACHSLSQHTVFLVKSERVIRARRLVRAVCAVGSNRYRSIFVSILCVP